MEIDQHPDWSEEAHEHICGLVNRIAELEAENRIFRSTESVDDSVWDALLEQVRVLQAERTCEWKAMPTGAGHEPGCGNHALAFASLTIHKFCPFCGGKIVEVEDE